MEVKRLSVCLSIALAVVGLGLLLAGSAFGHPRVQESNIADGAVFKLGFAPGLLTLVFNEEIDHKRSVVYVVRLQGRRIVDNGDLFVSENEMKISMNVLDQGVYQVRWIAISPDDAGFSEGTITFAVHFE
jgi:methionine-rich copper-binding protein CopC